MALQGCGAADGADKRPGAGLFNRNCVERATFVTSGLASLATICGASDTLVSVIENESNFDLQ